jgi:Uncharacterized membrane protein, required for colicin V production
MRLPGFGPGSRAVPKGFCRVYHNANTGEGESSQCRTMLGCSALPCPFPGLTGGNVPINVLDIGFGILILLFVVRGLLQGLIQEIAGFVGIFLGFVVAGRLYQQLVPQFVGVVNNDKWAAWISYGILFVATLIVVALLARLVKRFLTFTFTAWLDNLLGGVVGFAKGVFISAVGLAVLQLFVADSLFLKKSVMVPYLEGIVAFARSLLPAFIHQ